MKLIFLLLAAVLILITCINWFLPGNLTGGDSIFYFKEAYKNFPIQPYAWSTDRGAGLGEINVPLLWGYEINAFFISVLGKTIGFDWSIIYRFIFYFPYLIISLFSAWYLAKKTIVQDTYAIFASLIYTLNTYILMIMAGGQANFGLSYALVPIVLYKFIALFECTIDEFRNKQSVDFMFLLRSAIISGILLSLQMMLDLRVAYVTLLAFGLFFIMNIGKLFTGNIVRNNFLVLFFVFIFPIGITVLLLAYWIIPTIVIGANPVDQLGGGYGTQAQGVIFLSFAKYENTLSLLHPNWPENIFGKVYFMRPEYLLLPIMAFSSLLFLKTKNKEKMSVNKFILYFALLGLIGAFFAKGANDPFGGVYLWLFSKVPGFNAFRDPTKWYAFIAISYSVLIPYTIQQLTTFKKEKDSD